MTRRRMKAMTQAIIDKECAMFEALSSGVTTRKATPEELKRFQEEIKRKKEKKFI